MPEVDIPGAVAHLRSSFDCYRTRDIGWRLEQLRRLKRMVLEHEADIFAALKQDLGKSTFDSWLTETGFVVSNIDYAIKYLRVWMKPEKVTTPEFIPRKVINGAFLGES
jgi:aldehyde dehydrogenase (NAD+)